MPFPFTGQWLATKDNGGVDLGYYAGSATTESDAIRIGFFAGAGENFIGTSAVCAGRHAGYDANGQQSVFLGHAAGQYAGKGGDASGSVIAGYLAGRNAQQVTPHNGFLAVVIGAHAVQDAGSFQTATIIGARAGAASTTAAGCVFLGHQAGYSLSRNNSLVIDSGQDLGAGSFIYGEFDTRLLKLNASSLGFFGVDAVTRPVITGDVEGGSVLQSLLQGLNALGLIDNQTT